MATIKKISSRLFLGNFIKNLLTIKSKNQNIVSNKVLLKYIASSTSSNSKWEFLNLDQALYEKICSETLEGLCEYFEELVEKQNRLDAAADVTYGDGVLTVNFGQTHGTYVINRQSPNKQIWLSSPTTGPKRYDFLSLINTESGKWIYKHSNESLHELLQNEIKNILKEEVNFFHLPYAT